jgi:hypothetical protein
MCRKPFSHGSSRNAFRPRSTAGFPATRKSWRKRVNGWEYREARRRQEARRHAEK